MKIRRTLIQIQQIGMITVTFRIASIPNQIFYTQKETFRNISIEPNLYIFCKLDFSVIDELEDNPNMFFINGDLFSNIEHPEENAEQQNSRIEKILDRDKGSNLFCSRPDWDSN